MNRISKAARTSRLHSIALKVTSNVRRGVVGLLAASALGAGLAAPAQAATFAVTYTDGASEGFFDPSLGAARRGAFEASLSYWSRKLGASATTITVTAAFDNLGGDANGAVLAQAGPVNVHANFTSTNPEFRSNTIYGSALANHLAGRDILPNSPEIRATFNSDVDNATVLGPQGFYYGLDSNPPEGDSDFFSVALHEIGHGLNFLSNILASGAYNSSGLPGAYDQFLTQGNSASRTRLTAQTPAARGAALISNNLFFDGARTQTANGNTPAKIFAPNPYQSGSSVSHLDETFYSELNPSHLMTPQDSGPIHNAGPVGLGVFDDMGWSVDYSPVVDSITRQDLNPTSSRSVRFRVSFESTVTGVDASDFSVQTAGGLTGGRISSVSGSGTTYSVTVSGFSGSSGTVKLNLVDDDTISDVATASKLGGVGAGNGNFSNGPTYSIIALSTSGVSDLLSVNGVNDLVLRTTAPSTTPSQFADMTTRLEGPPNSFGITRAPDGTLYSTVSNYGLVARIPASGGTGFPFTPDIDTIQFAWDIVAGPDGMLYVSDVNSNTVVRVDPSNGGFQTILASGGSLNSPRGLCFGPGGALFCANAGNGIVVRIDLSTGAQTTFATLANGIEGIAFGPDGALYASNYASDRIIKVAPGGAQTNLVAANGIAGPRGMSYGADNFLYVAAFDNNTLVRIDPSTGAQTVVATGGGLSSPSDVFAAPAPAPVVSLGAGPSVTEGNSGTTLASFTLTRAGNSAMASTVTVATANGTATADSDYVAIPPTTVTFAAGDNTPKTIAVTINGDTAVEGDETFTLNLTNTANTTVENMTATATIVNDDDSNAVPVFVGAPYTFAFTQNRAIQGQGVNATDANGDTLTFALSGGALPEGITFNADGSFSGTPSTLTSALTRTVTVSDGKGGTATAQVTLSVVIRGEAIISEFRFRGKSGALDEYVELYNKRGFALNISGWSIQTRTATGLQTSLVPDGKIIPPFGRYLFTGSGFSLSPYGTSDQAIAADVLDASGVALFNAAGAVQDAVGFTTSDAALKEGAGLPSAPTSNGEYAFVRDTTGTLPKDTADSTQDFVFVIADADATTPTALATVSGTGGNVVGRLGAPSPEGIADPAYANPIIAGALLDPSVSQSAAPNRERVDFVPGTSLGALLIRRTITNNSGRPITKLRFSVASITSLGTPGPSTQADVRLVSSGNENVTIGGASVPVKGLTLETGAAGQPALPLSGGLGSSAVLGEVSMGTPLANGESRSVVFRLQIVKSGAFSVLFNFHAAPGS